MINFADMLEATSKIESRLRTYLLDRNLLEHNVNYLLTCLLEYNGGTYFKRYL